jgi:biotin carboxyl carrier protein
MHGRVVHLHVSDGDEVKTGQLLLVMEAMKMEHHLHAPRDGVVKHVAVQAGAQVALRQSLVHFV